MESLEIVDKPIEKLVEEFKKQGNYSLMNTMSIIFYCSYHRFQIFSPHSPQNTSPTSSSDPQLKHKSTSESPLSNIFW